MVHHVPDSHMHGYVRFKLALTKDQPAIKPYREGEWAKLSDSLTTPVDVSLHLLAALHVRWVELLRAMQPADLARTLKHPEHGVLPLDQMLALYARRESHFPDHDTFRGAP